MNTNNNAPELKPIIDLSDLDSTESIFKRLASRASFTGFPIDALAMEVERIKGAALALETNASAGARIADAYLANAMNSIGAQLNTIEVLLLVAADNYNALRAELEQLKAGAQ